MSPEPSRKGSVLSQRVAIILLLLPFLAWLVAFGGASYTIVFALALGIAAREYGVLFRSQGYRPAMPLLAGGVVSLVLLRGFFDFEWMAPALAGWCLITQAWHIVDYERGAAKPATDFTITLAGIVFLGWIGAYLVSLRLMANGLWWLLLTLPTIWTADAGAYIVGHAIGRRKLAPRVSPQKTWEGYLAGGMIGTIGGAGLALLWRIGAGPDSGLTALNGLILGAAISFVAPIGDLGISMLKREMHVKDTSGLIPGHGGAMDRMDSWLWAGVIAYYMINHLLVG